MKCNECKYWLEAQGTDRLENIGGCTFVKNNYLPMFLEEECALIEPYKTKVWNEHHNKR